MAWTSKSWRSRRRLTASKPARHSPSPWLRHWTTGFSSETGFRKDAAGWKRLVAVARGIDPEPLRDRLRSTWGQPVSEMQDELRRLADSIDIRAQHPATLVMSGPHPPAKPSTRTPPSGFCGTPNTSTREISGSISSWAYALDEQKDHEGAIRFYTAAVSIRPNWSAPTTTSAIPP